MQRREADWFFAFGDNCGLTAGAAWRIVGRDGIALTDGDDGQLFGRAIPIDAESEATAILAGLMVVGVTVRPITSDLSVSFTDGVALEVINTSSGYEAWQAYSIGNGGPTTIVAMGGGGLSVHLA